MIVMDNNKIITLDEAVNLINNGNSITTSGISIHRNPMSFIYAMIKTGIRDLYFIDREPGFGLEVLLKYNAIKKLRIAMSTLEWFSSIPKNFRKMIENKEVELLEDTCGAFIAGIRAGAFGVPFMPVRGIIGSDLIKLHEKEGTWKVVEDPFNNQKIVLVKAITPDVAIIHVNKADEEGNAEILGPLYEDVYKAKASKKVIITAEEIVPRSYFFGRRPTINGIYVTAVVHSPNGAYPTSMFPLYDADYEKIIDFLEHF
ncbi:CoA transferase subunit A [Sulfolobus sp. A20-N-F6]|uniref:CoA transferase subunit A n=1 Tax=Sulfolobaceae TaxID=118883 RepID=UPI0009F366CF|nr:MULTISPECIES: CoA-transferase [unclassified Sulfolobus]TRM76178.1 CoA transferase subunit A [Sulfolobus sp. E5]TRM79235.1 CoA transferase subunit A [Sulfolobus sp. B5]TRM81527.1 CoA transferase subunit A [Sulfolobus sp. D5]TRM83770.1 CoA transferase subunit A [Sulfolobus sp. A20-N-F6]TRM86873.1 CoA transferase subunit A [Sulfolobus sp. E3]TRM88934.1 CoA transferase subunit A [Sulfolobus sp. C3]TRM93075.1 CoA transferase subunit A [Sulfolobus sp. A20-N-G8]TRM98317.1 CoA transferase subuni